MEDKGREGVGEGEVATIRVESGQGEVGGERRMGRGF